MNIDDINCWTVQLLPFHGDEKKDIKLVDEFQKNICIDYRIFGMGWSNDEKTGILKNIFKNFDLKDYINTDDANQLISLENKKITNNHEKLKYYETKSKIEISDFFLYIYKQLNKNEETKGLENALKRYKEIKKDDIVISRLKNGKYYVGRVKNAKIKYVNEKIFEKQNDIFEGKNSTGFSWCCEVYKWYSYSENEIPGHISGRFINRSSRSTINIISTPTELKKLVKKIYFNKENSDNDFKGEKLNIEITAVELNEKTFAQSLHPFDLEDLVYLYILKETNNKYILLPSKCKIDEVRYEALLMCKNNPNKIIAFQAKNQERIDCELYKNEIFEKIYLFSGKGYDNKEIVEKYNNIEIIDNDKLFKILKNSIFYKEKFDEVNGYYS